MKYNRHDVFEGKVSTNEPVAESTEAEKEARVVEPTVNTGIVISSYSLNMRKEPSIDSEIIYVLGTGSEVQIFIDESTEDFYKICTVAGVEGYCMRKFIALDA